LTREELRAALKDEETAASLVHVLMTVGQGVRSTPMQWAKESKELDCAVKQLSWAPPWVLPAAGFDPREEPWCYVGDNEQVQDPLGRGSDGRIPATWWTLNHRYNFDYEVHRLCLADGLHVTGSTMEEDARRALCACDDAAKKFRYRFVRHAPDIAVYIHALRAELHMRIVMPAVLGHSREVPYLSMARFEAGAGGNMHWHGMSYGVGNPRIDKAREELVQAVPAPDARSDEARSAATDPPPGPEGESSSAPSPESVDEDEDMEDGRRYAAPARARPRTKTVGPASATARGGGRPQKRGKRGRGAAAGRGASSELGPDAADPVLPRPEPVTQEAKEELFWKYFHDKVSEWNPCFGEGEEVRFRWGEDVGAHDVDVAMGDADGSASDAAAAVRLHSFCPDVASTPHTVRLSSLLEKVLLEPDGTPRTEVDLNPVRQLVAPLVNNGNRHDRHGKLAPDWKKDACARGKP